MACLDQDGCAVALTREAYEALGCHSGGLQECLIHFMNCIGTAPTRQQPDAVQRAFLPAAASPFFRSMSIASSAGCQLMQREEQP